MGDRRWPSGLREWEQRRRIRRHGFAGQDGEQGVVGLRASAVRACGCLGGNPAFEDARLAKVAEAFHGAKELPIGTSTVSSSSTPKIDWPSE